MRSSWIPASRKDKLWELGKKRDFRASVVISNPSHTRLVFLSLEQVFTWNLKSLEPGVLRQNDNGGNYSSALQSNLALLAASLGRQAQNANDMIAFIKSSFYDCIISVIKTFTNTVYEAGRMLH